MIAKEKLARQRLSVLGLAEALGSMRGGGDRGVHGEGAGGSAGWAIILFFTAKAQRTQRKT